MNWKPATGKADEYISLHCEEERKTAANDMTHRMDSTTSEDYAGETNSTTTSLSDSCSAMMENLRGTYLIFLCLSVRFPLCFSSKCTSVEV